MLYFNLKNNREKLQSHQITVQNLRIKINVHFYIWKEREKEYIYLDIKDCIFVLIFEELNSFEFIVMKNKLKFEILFNSKVNPSFEHLSFCFNLDKTFF